jgi:hypothetical protein
LRFIEACSGDCKREPMSLSRKRLPSSSRRYSICRIEAVRDKLNKRFSARWSSNNPHRSSYLEPIAAPAPSLAVTERCFVLPLVMEPHPMNILQFPSRNALGQRSSSSEAAALEAALSDMTAAFSNDFAGGRVGQRHNTFAHRTRILRQMGAELAEIRIRDGSPPGQGTRA